MANRIEQIALRVSFFSAAKRLCASKKNGDSPWAGQKGPGKSKLDAFQPEIESLLVNGLTQRFIAQRNHTTEANLHNCLKKHGMKMDKAHTPA